MMVASFFVQTLEETLGQIQLCSTLEALLLKKQSLSSGDSPKMHAEKVRIVCDISVLTGGLSFSFQNYIKFSSKH